MKVFICGWCLVHNTIKQLRQTRVRTYPSLSNGDYDYNGYYASCKKCYVRNRTNILEGVVITYNPQEKEIFIPLWNELAIIPHRD